jgi:hypothetical protein
MSRKCGSVGVFYKYLSSTCRRTSSESIPSPKETIFGCRLTPRPAHVINILPVAEVWVDLVKCALSGTWTYVVMRRVSGL